MTEEIGGKNDLASLSRSLESLSETCRQQSQALAEQAARLKEMEAELVDRERMIRWQEQTIQWQERSLKERRPAASGEASFLQQELDRIVNSTAYRFGTFFSKKIAWLKRLFR